MTDAPPFDPPYTTTYRTDETIRVVETLADGTTREVEPIPARDFALQAAQGDAAAHPGKPPTAKATNKPLSGSRSATLYLAVPFGEKDEAKKLGARWDAAMRKWYVPHGVDIHLFNRWWPEALKQEAKASGQL